MAGSRIPMRIAIIPMTTNNSTSENAGRASSLENLGMAAFIGSNLDERPSL
jgi:hypothetical protein